MFGNSKVTPSSPAVVIHVHGHHDAPGVVGPTNQDLALQMEKIMAAIDEVVREVAELRTVHEGAIATFQGIVAELEAVRAELVAQGVTNERLNALASELDGLGGSLANAIRVNTVADPAAPSPSVADPAAPNPEPPVVAVEPAPADPAPADPAAQVDPAAPTT